MFCKNKAQEMGAIIESNTDWIFPLNDHTHLLLDPTDGELDVFNKSANKSKGADVYLNLGYITSLEEITLFRKVLSDAKFPKFLSAK